MPRIIDLRSKSSSAESAPPSAETVSQSTALNTEALQHAYEQVLEKLVSERDQSRTEQVQTESEVIAETTSTPKIITWSGLRFYHRPHMTTVWLTLLLLVGSAVTLFVFFQNSIAAILFLFLAGMLLVHIRHDLESTDFEVSYRGVRIGNRQYHFREIESFWIEYEPQLHIKELSLHLKHRHMPYIKLPLHEENPVQIRELMIDFIPEIQHHDGLSEILARAIGL